MSIEEYTITCESCDKVTGPEDASICNDCGSLCCAACSGAAGGYCDNCPSEWLEDEDWEGWGEPVSSRDVFR